MKTYFAEIGENNIVLRVVVSDSEFIQSGVLGNPENWVETFNDGTRKQPAKVGGTWDPENNVFIGTCRYPSWTLNDNFDWTAPVEHPDRSDCRYVWHEVKQKWVIPGEED